MQKLITSFQAVARGYMQRRQVKKKLYRHDAIGVVQENLLAFSTLQDDPWWQLFVRMKPLVSTAKAAEEEEAKRAAIAAMEAKIDVEKKHVQKLEVERRSLEAEMRKLEQNLNHERNLTSDSQEMLRRSKVKEQELQDQLDSILKELEESDNNYDNLMDSFAESQRTVERMRSELNLGAQLVQKLQEEKIELLEEIEELSNENGRNTPSEEHLERIRQLSSPYSDSY